MSTSDRHSDPAAPARNRDLVPEDPGTVRPDTPATKPEEERDATRFGDWEVKGRCIDFS